MGERSRRGDSRIGAETWHRSVPGMQSGELHPRVPQQAVLRQCPTHSHDTPDLRERKKQDKEFQSQSRAKSRPAEGFQDPLHRNRCATIFGFLVRAAGLESTSQKAPVGPGSEIPPPTAPAPHQPPPHRHGPIGTSPGSWHHLSDASPHSATGCGVQLNPEHPSLSDLPCPSRPTNLPLNPISIPSWVPAHSKGNLFL